MENLLSYEKTKQKIEELQNYIDLIDNYEIISLNNWVIKNYAMTNNIQKVIGMLCMAK